MSELGELELSLRGWLTGQIRDQMARMESAARTRPALSLRHDYILTNQRIQRYLHECGLEDPNPFQDLDDWNAKWRTGDVASTARVRQYAEDIYSQVLAGLAGEHLGRISGDALLLGWARVDRALRRMFDLLRMGTHEEDFQAVGLYAREVIISVAQAAYDPTLHRSPDGVTPSSTDAKRMLEAFLESVASGAANDVTRRYARSCISLAIEVQHRRSATYRAAALCAESARSLATMVAVLTGRRDPLPRDEPST